MCKLEFGWRLHRKIGRFLTFKDSVDVTRRLPIGRLFDHFISTAAQRSSAAISPPNATNRNALWQPSISASKSPESSGKTQRRLLLGAPIACSLRSSWPRENRQPYRLRSPGNFTELLGGT
jgi:hypothetical protein